MRETDITRKRPELLAPAGDLEGIRTALRYGADAIYCGGPFMQLRAEKVGFTEESLAEAASLIHSYGARLHVTVNSFAVNSEIPLLGDYARRLKDLGADALIVSDIGAIAEIKEKCPGIDVHVSTQANTMNYRACEVYYNMGASRVVLAREMPIGEIRSYVRNSPIDTEVFVHGAFCVCESGGHIAAVFFYHFGEEAEPTYADITDGQWTDSGPYGVVHRIASDGTVKGAGSFRIRWAFEQCGHLRMDTHTDNTVMRNLLKKLGFS